MLAWTRYALSSGSVVLRSVPAAVMLYALSSLSTQSKDLQQNEGLLQAYIRWTFSRCSVVVMSIPSSADTRQAV